MIKGHTNKFCAFFKLFEIYVPSGIFRFPRPGYVVRRPTTPDFSVSEVGDDSQFSSRCG
jgi:hypothetical protein